jgi:hypothetical protein
VRFGPLLAVTTLTLPAFLSIAACVTVHPDSTVEANLPTPSAVPSPTTDGCVEGYYRSGNYCLKNEIPF